METEKKYYGFMTRKQYIVLSVVIYTAIVWYLLLKFSYLLSPQTISLIESIIVEILQSIVWAMRAGAVTYVVTKIIKKNIIN